jgi:exodeoxyribonuclease VII small subunit
MSKKMSPDSPPPAPRQTFEEALGMLQQIVQQLEQGELSLTESLEKYEEGIRCLRYCYAQLQSAEERIELLTSIDAEGQASTEPFDEAAMTLEQKADTRGRRRSRPARRKEQAGGKPDAADCEDESGPVLF